MYESLISILILLVGFITELTAQNSRAERLWSLDDCISYAIDNNVEVLNANIDYKMSKADVAAATAAFSPNISASVDGKVSWGRNIDQETNTYMRMTQYSNGYSVTASMNLFDGGETVNRWRQARVAKKRALTQVEQKKDDVAIGIMNAYINAVYYKGSVALKDSKLQTSEELLRQAKMQYELGMKSQNDVALMQATYSSDESALLAEKKHYENAIIELKMYMNMPTDSSIDVDTVINDIKPVYGADSFDDVFRYAEENNPQIQDIKLEKQYYNLSYKTSVLSTLPTIEVYAQASTGYYKNLTKNIGDHFTSQFNNNHGEIVGMSIYVPIFDRLGRANRIKRAKLTNMKMDNVEKNVMQKLGKEVQLAIMDRDATIVEVNSLEKNVEASELAYNLACQKFREGLISAIEVRTSAELLYNSRLNLLTKKLTLISNQKLVDYYKGIKSWN